MLIYRAPPWSPSACPLLPAPPPRKLWHHAAHRPPPVRAHAPPSRRQAVRSGSCAAACSPSWTGPPGATADAPRRGCAPRAGRIDTDKTGTLTNEADDRRRGSRVFGSAKRVLDAGGGYPWEEYWRDVSTRPRPNASIRPHRPGMSRSSSQPTLIGSAGSTTRLSPTGSMPRTARSSRSGAPVDHACGLQAVGYWTGYFVIFRGYPPKASGRHPPKNCAAPRMPSATRAASSLKPYFRRPHAMKELSNGQTVPTW